jgi:hypothetical protein
MYLNLKTTAAIVDSFIFGAGDAVKSWQDEGAMDMENTIGSKYAKFPDLRRRGRNAITKKRPAGQ